MASIAPTAAAGTVVNTASVKADTTDNDLSDNSTTASSQVAPFAELEISKTGPAAVNAGENITYTIVAKNNGPSTAAATTMADPLPVGTTYVGSTTTTGTCSQANSTLTCALGAMAPGAQATMTLTVKVPADSSRSTVENTAWLTSPTDPKVSEGSAVVTTTVNKRTDLAVTKVANTDPVVAGTTETFKVEVTAAGPSEAAGVTLTDPPVAGMTITSASTTVGTCSVTVGMVNCPIGKLAVGAKATITVTATIASTPTRPRRARR